MANQEQLELLKKGVDAWNEWRKKNPSIVIDLSNANLSETDLRKANLSNADLRKTDLSNANLREANLNNTYLNGSRFDRANLSEVDLREANLSNADMYSVNLRGAVLRGTNLSNANLNKAEFNGADLSKADLSGANLNGAYLSKADLREANLFKAKLVGADLSGAILVRADIGDADLNNADLSGANLIRANLSKADLSETNFSKADLSGANLREAKLNGADLSKTNLRGAEIYYAILNEADLSNADLNKADLVGADLRNADLSKADLVGADLSEADLSGAKMLNANLVKSNFFKANITGAKLYGSARDDWKIERIICNYIYWDDNGEIRTPKDWDFRPGEFEVLYKQLPTFDYFFENGFRPIDAVLMSQIVDEINQKNPEFELKLDSFHSRGQPHAKFTVIHKEHVEEASKQVAQVYNIELKTLKGKMEDLEKTVKELSAQPKKITYVLNALHGDVMTKNIQGNNYENKDGQMAIGNDIIQANHGSQITITRDITNGSSPEEFIGYLNYLLQELTKQKISDEIKAEIEHELKGAQIQTKKPDNKDKVAEKLKGTLDVLKNTGALAAESVTFGKMIGKAIEWCGHIFTGL